MFMLKKDCKTLPMDRNDANSFFQNHWKFAVVIYEPNSNRYHPFGFKTLEEAESLTKRFVEYGYVADVALLYPKDAELKDVVLKVLTPDDHKI